MVYSSLTVYRKLPLITPGLIKLRGFRWAYKRRGLYPRGNITGIKKNRFETSYSSVDRNTFFIYWFLMKL